MSKSPSLYWRSSKQNHSLVGAHGIIEAVTRIWNAPANLESNVPYAVALISLDNGAKITSQVVDSDAKLGMKVEACIRKFYADGNDGIINYGIKFRVVK